MNIFVTVGTTPFDQLIRSIDLHCRNINEIQFQIANAEYIPVNFPYFYFSDQIFCYYERADIIICHAGAGTVYKLLEMDKKIIVVPNLFRSDTHQQDLAKFVEINEYALVCWDIEKINDYIQQSNIFVPKKYQKDEFTGHKLLNKIIKELYGK